HAQDQTCRDRGCLRAGSRRLVRPQEDRDLADAIRVDVAGPSTGSSLGKHDQPVGSGKRKVWSRLPTPFRVRTPFFRVGARAVPPMLKLGMVSASRTSSIEELIARLNDLPESQ